MVNSIKFVDKTIVYTEASGVMDIVDFGIWVKGPDQNHEGF